MYSRDFPIIITRPFNYTGPGQSSSFLVPKIVRHYAQRQRDIKLGNLDLFRDFSDVGRVTEAYARLLSLPMVPAVVNICSGRALHLLEIPRMMEEISGHTVSVMIDPTLIRTNEPRIIFGSSSRLESLVGTLPNPEFHETLQRIYDSFRKAAECH